MTLLAVADEVGAWVRGSAGVGVVHAPWPTLPLHLTRWPGCGKPWPRATAARSVAEAPPEVQQAVDVWGPAPGLDPMRRTVGRPVRPGPGSRRRFAGGI